MCRSENHNFLPNIVGPWLPQCDGEDSTRPYYYASMLALLKPWRELEDLKRDDENWEFAFNTFMETASRRDRDVVAGCQYYYNSRISMAVSDVEEDTHVNVYLEDDEERDNGEGDSLELTVASISH